MIGLLAAEVTVSTGALVAAIAVGVAEIALAVFCIVDVVRRPAVAGGRKWVWIVIIVLVGLIGSIIYLAVGRAAPPAVAETRDEPESLVRTRAQSAADLLYGAPKQPGDDAGGAGPQ